MEHRQLRDELERLNAELRQAASLDDEEREMLRSLATEIEELLARDNVRPHHYSGLNERLKGAVARLEASHPQVTLLMRRVIDSLSYLGI